MKFHIKFTDNHNIIREVVVVESDHYKAIDNVLITHSISIKNIEFVKKVNNKPSDKPINLYKNKTK